MSAILQSVPELRLMAEADLPAVMAIETEIYAFPWTQGNFRDSLAAGYTCWICVRDGILIGYAVAMMSADEVHLLNLSMATACQRQGYGSLLLARLCEFARGQAARQMILEVRPSNYAALRLYERNGFQRVGLRREYYPAQGGREDALILGLPL